ncbi:MAG: hypothetical protein LBR54_00865, partial [Oscillospiraceae bacterium]|nr:hypothetical protein [Oscillospiraceae bacterium]
MLEKIKSKHGFTIITVLMLLIGVYTPTAAYAEETYDFNPYDIIEDTAEETQYESTYADGNAEPVRSELNMSLFHHNSAALAPSADMSELHTLMYNKIKALDAKPFDIGKFKLTIYQLEQELMTMIRIHPDVYYWFMKAVYYTYHDVRNHDRVIGMQFGFGFSTEQINAMNAKYEEEISYILDNVISPDMSEAEKVFAIHEHLNSICIYEPTPDKDNDGNPDDFNEDGIIDYQRFSSYDILVDKQGVCEAYTAACRQLFDRLGISSDYVTSDPMNHIWNIVNVDGKFYHLDVTWGKDVYITIGKSGHGNLLQSESAITKIGRNRHWGFAAPYGANHTEYDEYFWIDIENSMTYLDG